MTPYNTFVRPGFLVALFVILSVGCSGDPAQKRDQHMKRGDAYFDKQEFKKAIIEYRNAVQADARYARGHFQLALAYLKTAQPKQAFEAFTRTVDLDPENIDAQLRLGQFYLAGKRVDDARQKALLVLEKDPENLDALFLQMGVGLQQGDPSVATEALEKILSVDPDNIRARIALARIAGSQRQFEAAHEHLRKALQAHPDDSTIKLELARLYEQRRRPDEAQKVLEALTLENPEDVSLLNQLASFYLRQGKAEEAEKVFVRAAEASPENIGPMMTLGGYYASREEWDKAISWMEKALQIQPENLEIQAAIASLHMERGNLSESMRLTDQVLEKDATNFRARLLKARLLVSRKSLPEAEQLLQALATEHPGHGGVQYYLGLVYLAQNEPAKAKGALLEAVESDPVNLKARILLAQTFLAERSADLALEQAKTVLSRDHGNFQALLAMATAYAQKRDFAKSRELLLRATQVRPDEPGPYYQLALVETQERRYDEAGKHIDKVLTLMPDHMPALAAKVSLAMSQGRTEQAISFLEKRIKAQPENPRLLSVLHELRGSALLALQRYPESEAAFQEALSLNPDLTGPYLSLARLYLAKKETEKAIAQYREILEKKPAFIQAHMALGAIYDAGGDSEKAQQAYEKALEIRPDFAPAANNLAWLLLQRDAEPDRALALAKQAKSQLPDDPAVGDTLGLAYLVKGLYPSAIAELSDVAEKMPHNPTVLYHLGLAHWKNNERDQAMEALKRALNVRQAFPEKEKARALLTEIETS